MIPVVEGEVLDGGGIELPTIDNEEAKQAGGTVLYTVGKWVTYLALIPIAIIVFQLLFGWLGIGFFWLTTILMIVGTVMMLCGNKLVTGEWLEDAGKYNILH